MRCSFSKNNPKYKNETHNTAKRTTDLRHPILRVKKKWNSLLLFLKATKKINIVLFIYENKEHY